GGNTVSCAAALAVLDVIETEGLQKNATLMGQRLMARLSAMSERYPLLNEIRGAGLMIGAEIRDGSRPDSQSTARIVNDMRAAGILISSCGEHHNVLKIRPPLVIKAEEVDLFVDTLGQVLENLNGAAS